MKRKRRLNPLLLRRIECKDTLPPKVVILDLHLRGENGMDVNGGELFEKIRKVWPQTRIIVSSADIAWCQMFNEVADRVLEEPIVNMAHFLDQVQLMIA